MKKFKRERRGISKTKPIIFFFLEITIICQILYFFYIANIYVFYVLVPIAIGYILISPLPRLADVYRRIDSIQLKKREKFKHLK
jgi:hypothetical protein